MSILIGGILGLLVGCIVWAVVVKAGINLSVIQRAAIGIFFILFLIAFRDLLGNENNGLIPPTPTEVLINVLLLVLTLGALPGIVARPKNRGNAHP